MKMFQMVDLKNILTSNRSSMKNCLNNRNRKLLNAVLNVETKFVDELRKSLNEHETRKPAMDLLR